jgi:hypothetical protein
MQDPNAITDILGLGKVGEKAIEVAGKFLERILGAAADQAGEALADPIRSWRERRTRRAIATVTEAASLLQTARRRAIPVPGRILFPLLDAASVEEDPEVRRMWATLLAQSADEAKQGHVLPSFVSILKELSPTEAAVLQAVYLADARHDRRIDYEASGMAARFNPRFLRIYSEDHECMFSDIEMPFGNYRVLFDNLARLGLVEQSFAVEKNGGYRVYSELALTPLGYHFIAACTEPPGATTYD